MTYSAMLQALRAGQQVAAEEIERICTAAGVSAGKLALDLVAGRLPGRRSGDRCPACDVGRLRVASSKRREFFVVQYLECTMMECDFRAKKTLAPDQVPRRRSRVS